MTHLPARYRRTASLLAGALWPLFLTLLPVAAEATIPCSVPTNDWITGADIAAAVPGLGGLPADLKVSYAPVPGLERVFRPDELRRLAQAHQLAEPAVLVNICFGWTLAPLAPASLRGAMEKTLEGRKPSIEILEQSNAPAPPGEIVFPLAGLSAYTENPAIWKGYVLFAGTRHFAIWARVRVKVQETHLLARGPLRAGSRLSEEQWRTEAYSGPLLRERTMSGGAELDGLVLRRDLADGAPLIASLFDQPAAVERGDTVTVSVSAGSARIETQGVALAGGRSGEVIAIRNPRSNRTFKARIAALGRVEALPGTSQGLVGTDAQNGNPL